MRRVVIAFGLLLLATAAARTQQQQPNPAFRAGVELVTVDVIVVDKAGVPIRGLTADDFTVTFDGKSRPVRAIDFLQYAEPPGVDETAPAVAGAAKPAPAAPADRGGRVFLIVFDDLSAKLLQAKFLTLAAERMLATLDDDDLVALMTTSGLGPVVQPTRDRDVILKALKSKTLIGRNDDNPAPRFFIGVNEAIEIHNGFPGTLRTVVERECGIRNYNPAMMVDSPCPNQVEMDAHHLGALTVHRTASQMASYRAAIAALAGAPKPRILVALSYGLATSPMDNLKEQTDAIARAAAEAGTQFYAIVEATPEFDMTLGKPGLELVIREEKNFLNSGAQVLATAAGGEAFLAVGQADRFFTRVQRETSGFYRLGVEAPLGVDRRRMLDAKVTVRGSGLTVRTNSHAILEAAAAEVVSPEERARTALAQGGASYGVPIALATALRRNPANADLQLGVSVQVPSAVPGPLVAMFALIDEAGQVVRNGRAQMTASGDANDYYLSLPVPLTSGRFKLRVVVADANGNIGGVEQPVAASLAQLGHFMASDLFTGWAADDGVTRFLALEALPERATTLQASLELYADGPAAASEVTVRFEIVPSGQTDPIFTRDVAPNRNGATLTASVALPTAELPAGVFDIVATAFEAGAETGKVTKRVRKGGG